VPYAVPLRSNFETSEIRTRAGPAGACSCRRHGNGCGEKAQAEARIAFGLKYRGPFGNERTDLTSLVFGTPVRVYREGTKTWEGPFKFISVDGDTVCVEVPSGRRIFRSNVVKIAEKQNVKNVASDRFIGLSDHTEKDDQASVQDFSESRKLELQVFSDRGVFEVVK
jgi:hypothetical protein